MRVVEIFIPLIDLCLYIQKSKEPGRSSQVERGASGEPVAHRRIEE